MHQFQPRPPAVSSITEQRPQKPSALMPAPRRRAKLAGCLATVCCLWAGAGAAQAEVLDRWYGSIGLGWSYANSLDLSGSDAFLEMDRGTDQLNFAVGRRLGDAWRVELDYSEFDRSPELIYSSSAGIEIDTDERDAIESSSLMLNLVRDFQVGRAWRPYLGVGAGTGQLDVHYSDLEIVNLDRPRRDIINDDDRGAALQFMAGFTIPVTRRLELAADFRYLRMLDLEMQEVSGAEVDTDHTVRSAWLHLRYNGSSAGVFNAPAPRQPFERGWYVTSSLGGSFAQDEDAEDTTLVIDAYDLGTTFTVGAGYRLHPRWRAELEASYWDNDVEVMEFSKDIGEDSASGSVESFILMANVIYQFAPESAIRPFVGIGGGWVRSSYDITAAGFCRRFVCDPVEQQELVVDDHGSTWGAQALFGVDVAITERLGFTASYRQLVTGTTDMERPDGTPFNTEKRFGAAVTAGVRYSLGR